MELNEIKKALYRQNPVAEFIGANRDGFEYIAHLKEVDAIHFKIPFHDIGDATFYREMEAKHLIRWIVKK